jgi:hypothetical protein
MDNVILKLDKLGLEVLQDVISEINDYRVYESEEQEKLNEIKNFLTWDKIKKFKNCEIILKNLEDKGE